jgi:hypothetical protein
MMKNVKRKAKIAPAMTPPIMPPARAPVLCQSPEETLLEVGVTILETVELPVVEFEAEVGFEISDGTGVLDGIEAGFKVLDETEIEFDEFVGIRVVMIVLEVTTIG